MRLPSFCCFLVAFGSALHAQPLRDFRRVVIADDALPVQRVAAEELAAYAGRIVGQTIEIVPLSNLPPAPTGLSFYLGEKAVPDVTRSLRPWKTEEYLLKSEPAGLILAGQDGDGDPWSMHTPAGSMLAVYTLLEDYLGVHWFWPGEFGEHVPSNPDAELPALNERRQPGFEIRAVSLGISSVYHPKGTVRTERSLSYHTPAFADAEAKWARRTRLGWVKSAGFSHSWASAFKTPKNDAFQQHPEWFALVNGVRKPPQMCTTEPAVIDHMVDFVLKGNREIVEISPNDGGGFCECERCRALDVPGVLANDHQHVSLSDRIFTYANEVARQVAEKDPSKGCGMYAYAWYNNPPVHIAKLEPNLYLGFVFQSAAQRDPDNLREWRETVAGWQKLGAKMIVREGWGNHYYHDLPFLHDRQIIANLAESHALGFVGVFGEGSKNFATMAPNYWAITHMLWDPTRDASRLMPDFYAAAYGPVAKEMAAYFETYDHALDLNWAKRDRVVDTNAIAYNNLIGSWNKFIPWPAVDEAEQHLRAAEAKAPAGEYADRVKFHRFGQNYTRAMLGLLEAYGHLTELGLGLDFSPAITERRDAPAEREDWLKKAYALGEQRESMLLAHRDWAGPDEGLYALTNDGQVRQWHAAVKKALGIEKPSAVTKATLNPR